LRAEAVARNDLSGDLSAQDESHAVARLHSGKLLREMTGGRLPHIQLALVTFLTFQIHRKRTGQHCERGAAV
jgi:hypothetical protein